jgi:hypothetical protein
VLVATIGAVGAVVGVNFSIVATTAVSVGVPVWQAANSELAKRRAMARILRIEGYKKLTSDNMLSLVSFLLFIETD